MNNTYYVRNKGNIIAFPDKSAHLKHKFSEETISQFIRALIQDNVALVKHFLAKHGESLAKIQGNYFCPPLLIASKHNNLEMVNMLLEHGACAEHALNDPRAKYISGKMKSYLRSIHQFGHTLWNKIEAKTHS
jgi:hypothetical protein